MSKTQTRSFEEIQFHTVLRTDTLAGIALRYNMKPSEIKRINNLGNLSVYAGQVLKVSAIKVPTQKKQPESECKFIQYTVQANDTLSSIALNYSTSANELKKINELPSPKIKEKQTILIPIIKQITLSQASLSKITWSTTHCVRSGESLRSLARYYRTTTFHLMKINNMPNEKLRVDQKIQVFNNRPNQDQSALENAQDHSGSLFIAQEPQTMAAYQPTPIIQPTESTVDKIINYSSDVIWKQLKGNVFGSPPKALQQAVESNEPVEEPHVEVVNVLIPHKPDSAVCVCTLQSDRILFEPFDPVYASEVGCPAEIEMKNIAQPKVVSRGEVIHSGYVPYIEQIGDLKYLQIAVQDESEAIHKNYYFGVNAAQCEPFCYRIFQLLCKEKIKQLDVDGYTQQHREEVEPPRLVDSSSILRDSMTHGLQMIRNNLPEKYKFYPWCLVYSTDRDGVSLRTFYKKLETWRVSLIFIEDSRGYVFGGFASGVWEVGTQYTGSGESFLFQLYPEAQLYPWAPQSNSCFMLGKHNHIEMGAGGSAGIWVDHEFNRGFSGTCATFRSPPLASSEDFICTVFEVWSFDQSNLRDYY